MNCIYTLSVFVKTHFVENFIISTRFRLKSDLTYNVSVDIFLKEGIFSPNSGKIWCN